MKRAAPLDALTVLTTKGPLATKRITAVQDGEPKIESYGKAQRFSFEKWDESSFDEMAAALRGAAAPRALVRRARQAGRRHRPQEQPAGACVPRGDEPATLMPQPRHWLALDLDSVPCPAGIDPIFEPDAVVEHVVELLPEEFHGVSVFWTFTSGHGIKPGIRIRLWFWLDRPVSKTEIKIWLAPQIAEKVIDPALYNPAQAIYTATPIFVGMPDPVPYRCGIWTRA